MNNKQPINDVYQTPSLQNGESFEAPSEVIDKKFYAIEREAVLQAFNQITQDLEMSLSGYESREIPEVEVAPAHPIATELMYIGNMLSDHREKYHAARPEKSGLKRVFGRMILVLFTNNPSEVTQPVVAKMIDRESEVGATLFPADADVTEMKFFFLPSEDATTGQVVDVWHHDQKSIHRAKNFTNSYKITESGIEKSSTYFDENLGRIVNRSSVPSDQEIENLLMAAKQYYIRVTEKVYVKPAAPRFRFGLKSDHDLAA